MSWSVNAIGKPSEIRDRIAAAVGPSPGKVGLSATLAATIVAHVACVVAGVDDETPHSTHGTTRRTIVVESNGHADQWGAQAQLTIRTIHSYEPPIAPIAGGDPENPDATGSSGGAGS